ncbi:MAG: hypothetical protein IPN70_00445 [Candidatus Moraniibacteriota bacterium]|nr:MAG: hypothetical protein IPN70_00445 [Candidatus Moranbacteria bacterium]
MYYYSLFFTNIRNNVGNIFFSALIGGVFVFLLLIFVPDAYKVRTDFLVMQHSEDSKDFYTLSKSAEYSGNVLREAVMSDLFLNEASRTNYFEREPFSGDERSRLKEWQNTVEVKQRSNAGILEVTVYRDSRNDAIGIAKAISDVLINQNTLFRSGPPESLSIKLISGPIVEQNPTIMQLIFGSIAGMILGIAIFFIRIWYKQEVDTTDYSVFAPPMKNKESRGGLIYDI